MSELRRHIGVIMVQAALMLLNFGLFEILFDSQLVHILQVHQIRVATALEGRRGLLDL